MKQLTITNVTIYGLERAAVASGNSFNPAMIRLEEDYCRKDEKRAKALAQTPCGAGEDQFLVGCIVQFDLYAPLYMWKQIQRYKFLDFESSQSTMHTLMKFDVDNCLVIAVNNKIKEIIISMIEDYKKLKEDTPTEVKETRWREIIASLPCGFVLGATMTTNYRQLKTIYHQRKNHRLSEWRAFCKWIEGLPHSEWITGK